MCPRYIVTSLPPSTANWQRQRETESTWRSGINFSCVSQTIEIVVGDLDGHRFGSFFVYFEKVIIIEQWERKRERDLLKLNSRIVVVVVVFDAVDDEGLITAA